MSSGKSISKYIVQPDLRPTMIRLSPGVFNGESEGVPYQMALGAFKNTNVAFNVKTYLADCPLPHGVTVTEFSITAYRDDAASALTISLYRINKDNGGAVAMATCTAAGVGGDHEVVDNTINNALVDLESYYYMLHMTIDNNNADTDVYLRSAAVIWTY